MSNLIGQTLLDQFRVDSFVAAGGMSAIYKVWDQRRNVALTMKVFHFDFDLGPSLFKPFEMDARVIELLT